MTLAREAASSIFESLGQGARIKALCDAGAYDIPGQRDGQETKRKPKFKVGQRVCRSADGKGFTIAAIYSEAGFWYYEMETTSDITPRCRQNDLTAA